MNDKAKTRPVWDAALTAFIVMVAAVDILLSTVWVAFKSK